MDKPVGEITLKEVYTKAIELETKLDMMGEFDKSSIKRFRGYSLLALLLIIINIIFTIVNLLIIIRA